MAQSTKTQHIGLQNSLSGPFIRETVNPFTRSAVIDIGSNSVRLVVFGTVANYPIPIFDERSNCQLGADIDKTGKLDVDRIVDAIETITRFAAVIKAMGVDTCYPIATAAVRRASNSDEFTVPAEQILGRRIIVLSQEEEATYVARGFCTSISGASGFFADLGGGSIEIIELKKGKIINSVSLNYGHLGNVAEDKVIASMASIRWLSKNKYKWLYTSGGSFRALGLAYIGREKYPVRVVHGTKIDASKALKICSDFVHEKPNFAGVPVVRQSTMPMAAKIIRSLIKISGVRKIFISGTSVRDGIISVNSADTDVKADFLVDLSNEIARSCGDFEELAGSLKRFLKPIIGRIARNDARLVEIACNLAHIGRYEHSDIRGDIAARYVLGLPVNCITHKERVWLSVALFHRHSGIKKNKPRPRRLDSLLSKRRVAEARTVGLAMRFALIFSAEESRYIDHLNLNFEVNKITLTINSSARDLFDKRCRRRFEDFVKSADCEGDIVYN